MLQESSIKHALDSALAAIAGSELFEKEAKLKSESNKHSLRSSEFVEQLRLAFELYLPDENQYVLAKTQKAKFTNRSEFLFNIVAVQTLDTPSPFSGRKVYVITDCLLQVESEFALDFNQAMIDFAKLLCGLSPVKLMVMPLFETDQNVNAWLQKHIFTSQRRQTDKAVYYLAYVEHPKHWVFRQPIRYELYVCSDQEINRIK